MKYVIIGAGSRGMIYGGCACARGETVAAVADPRPDRLAQAAEAFHVPEQMCFTDGETLLAQGKIADAAIITTQDRDHYRHAMAAMETGYDLLLEKPVSPSAAECVRIEQKAKELGRRITVCHVLRYTPFFTEIKRILDSGILGKIVSIRHSENIGNYHMAHSYVRGNWRNQETSSPIIIAKSCHDLDILLWLTGAHCTKVAAVGSLTYFNEAHAPEGSSDRCFTCPVRGNCRFDAERVYLPAVGSWPADVVCVEQTKEAVSEALKTGPYGRCVYRCDNNVCDHMSTLMEFDNGVTATFSLSGQSNRIHRSIHIYCEDGELTGDDERGVIRYVRFAANGMESFEEKEIHIRGILGGHSGGDPALFADFSSNLKNREYDSRSSIERSVESHLMALAMEQSRTTGEMIDMAEYRESCMA